MERIVVVVDPSGVETASLQFACYLTRLTGSKLTGLFLHGEAAEDIAEISLPVKGQTGSVSVPEKIPLSRSVAMEQNILDFLNYCENHGLRWKPDVAEAYNEKDILIESRFADLLIVCSDTSFSVEAESVPSDLVTSILKQSECPVLIAPLSFSSIDEVVFAYDGTPSSVYAIRQFTHLFPQLQDKKVTFLEVNEDFSTEIEYREKITNYLKMHYSAIGYQVLMGQAEDELFSYFLRKKNVMVVIGAFGKKLLSSILNKSTAHLLLKTTSLPVFITHR